MASLAKAYEVVFCFLLLVGVTIYVATDANASITICENATDFLNPSFEDGISQGDSWDLWPWYYEYEGLSNTTYSDGLVSLWLYGQYWSGNPRSGTRMHQWVDFGCNGYITFDMKGDGTATGLLIENFTYFQDIIGTIPTDNTEWHQVSFYSNGTMNLVFDWRSGTIIYLDNFHIHCGNSSDCSGTTNTTFVPPSITILSPTNGSANVPNLLNFTGNIIKGTYNYTYEIWMTENGSENWSEVCSSMDNVSTNTSFSCPVSGLGDLTEYKWYVNVSDELTTISSGIYYFSTYSPPGFSGFVPENNSVEQNISLYLNGTIIKGSYDYSWVLMLAENGTDIWSQPCGMNGSNVSSNYYFSSSVSLAPLAVYKWYVNATDQRQTTNSGTYYFTTHTLPSDLWVAADNISFMPAIPKKGATGNITALIHNSGNWRAVNVVVRFYEGLNGTRSLIGEANVSEIPAGWNATARVQWTPAEAGPHTITVIVDPDNAINETNKENNQASKEVTVATYRVLVVGTYYSDEDSYGINNSNAGLIERTSATSDYYWNQSYQHDFIGFSVPVYLNISKPSTSYPSYDRDPTLYLPPPNYADDLCNLLKNNGFDTNTYDAILNYQTHHAVGNHSKIGFHPVTYRPNCGPISLLSTIDNYGTSSHELGHALYGFADLYSEKDQWGFEIHRGEVGSWSLMGTGNLISPPAPLSSFDKEEASWVSYNTTHVSDLASQPKEFQVTLLEKIGIGGKVNKINGWHLNIPYVVEGYDYLLESRTESEKSGIVIYQDLSTLPWGSFLTNLKPQSGDESHATLSSNSPIYRSAVTGLQFRCLDEACSIDENSKTDVVVGFNVSGYSNGRVAKINMVTESNSSSNSSSSFPYVKNPYFKNFGNILPLNSSVTDGHFKNYFVNLFNSTIEIMSVNFTESLEFPEMFLNKRYKHCEINTSLPMNVSSNGVFSLETDNCVDSSYIRVVVGGFDPVIQFNLLVFLGNGSIESKTINGQMYIVLPLTERNPNESYYQWNTIDENGTITSVYHEDPNVGIRARFYHQDYSWVYLVIAFLVVWLSLFVVFRKNRRASFVLVAVLLFLILLGVFFAYQEDSRRAGIMDFTAPVLAHSSSASDSGVENLSAPNVDLHAYDDIGRHVGMNYSSGVFENQIPGAIASGDMYGEQWIFVPNGPNVSFIVDGHDISQYLSEINSSENLTLNYGIQFMQYGPNPSVEVVNDSVVILDRTVDEPINASIGAGMQQVYNQTSGCSSGGISVCGANYCCGVSDGVCPEFFDNVSCGVPDPDCSSCLFGGVSVCGTSYCCGVADGVCPSVFEGISCSTGDVDCS